MGRLVRGNGKATGTQVTNEVMPDASIVSIGQCVHQSGGVFLKKLLGNDISVSISGKIQL